MCVRFRSTRSCALISHAREPRVCVTTLPPDDKAVRASTGSHKITRDFSDIFFIVLWDCTSERCATNTSPSNAHWGDHKSSSSSIRSRQQLQQLKTLTHTYTFVALEKSFHRCCTHLFFIMHTYSACTRVCCAATPTTSFATHSLSGVDLKYCCEKRVWQNSHFV
jgi:hypothetical protein